MSGLGDKTPSIVFRARASGRPLHRMTRIQVVLSIWLILFLLLMIFSLYRIYADFLPSGAYLDFINIPSHALAALLTIPMLIMAIRPPANLAASYRSMGWKRLFVPIMPVIVFFMMRTGVLEGTPAVLHHLAEHEEYIQILPVTSKGSSFDSRRGRCNGGVYVDDPALSDLRIFGDVRICGVRRDDWEEVDAGDTIRLIGERSVVGLAYQSYSITKLD
jgi:hypothetical protein